MATRISQQQLANMLKELKGTTFATIEYFVDESKSRVIAGKKQVQKLVRVNVTLGSNYENKVNKIATVKQDMEVNFESQAMIGKSFVGGCLIKADKSGDLMLYATIEKNAKRQTTYFHKGIPHTVEQLKPLDVLAPSFFAEKPTMGRGLVEKENDFALISPKLSNIKYIKTNKMEFEIL